jgi:hypothetical protein
MNHEIQHNSHIRSPRAKLGEPMRLDKLRTRSFLAERSDRPIEPFDMPDLK